MPVFCWKREKTQEEGGEEEGRIASLKIPCARYSPFSWRCQLLSFPGALFENANTLKRHGTEIQNHLLSTYCMQGSVLCYTILWEISDSLEGMGDKWKRGKRKQGERERQKSCFPYCDFGIRHTWSICRLCHVLCDLGQARMYSDTTLEFHLFNSWKVETMTLGHCGNKMRLCM